MGESDSDNPLKSLGEKIDAAKKAIEPVEPVQNKFSAAEVGWRTVSYTHLTLPTILLV